MLVRYTILVSLTFILLSDLSRILIKMHEGSKYVLQMMGTRFEIINSIDRVELLNSILQRTRRLSI